MKIVEEKNVVLDEVLEETSFIKKIIFKAFKEDFIKVYKKGVKQGFNWSNNVR